MSTAEHDEAVELVRAHGVFKRRAKHGELWRIGSSVVLIPVAHGSPEWRSSKNTLASVRRAIRGEAVDEERDADVEVAALPAPMLAVPIPEVVEVVSRRRVTDAHGELRLAPHHMLALLKLAGRAVPENFDVSVRDGYVVLNWHRHEEVEES